MMESFNTLSSAGIGAGIRLRGLVKAMERRLSLFPSEHTSFRLEDDLVFDKNCQDPSSLDIVENEIRNLVLTMRELIPALNDEADAVQRVAARLRARDYRQINSLRPAVALPVEILANIFLLSTCAAAIDARHRSRQTITTVCHHWRVSAIGTPDLWSSVFLRVRNTSSDVLRPPAPLVELILERASKRPLDLTINFSEHVSQPLEHSDPTASVIRAALSQSRSANLSMRHPSLLSPLLSPSNTPIPLPALTSLKMTFSHTFKSISLDLSQAPLLRDIFREGRATLALPSSSASTIQSVWLSSIIDLAGFLQVTTFQNLKQLRLAGYVTLSGLPATVEFPQLERLACSDPQMMDRLVTPKLRYLFLSRDLYPRRGQFPALRYVETGENWHFHARLGRFTTVERLVLRVIDERGLERVLENLCRRVEDGKHKFMPHLRDIQAPYTSFVENTMTKLISTRNRGKQENPGMHFTMKLHCYSSNRSSFESFLARHPWSALRVEEDTPIFAAFDESFDVEA